MFWSTVLQIFPHACIYAYVIVHSYMAHIGTFILTFCTWYVTLIIFTRQSGLIPRITTLNFLDREENIKKYPGNFSVTYCTLLFGAHATGNVISREFICSVTMGSVYTGSWFDGYPHFCYGANRITVHQLFTYSYVMRQDSLTKF